MITQHEIEKAINDETIKFIDDQIKEFKRYNNITFIYEMADSLRKDMLIYTSIYNTKGIKKIIKRFKKNVIIYIENCKNILEKINELYANGYNIDLKSLKSYRNIRFLYELQYKIEKNIDIGKIYETYEMNLIITNFKNDVIEYLEKYKKELEKEMNEI